MSGAWADLLRRHGIRPGRRLGQHFLFEPGILARIAAAAEIAPGDPVLEVGPGVGSLTAELVRRGAEVLAIELDRSLGPALRETLVRATPAVAVSDPLGPRIPPAVPSERLAERVWVCWGDAVRIPWAELQAPQPWCLCSNLPYYLTGPFLAAFLGSGLPWRGAVLLVQEEAAARMTASPGSAAYGAFTCLVAYHATVSRLFAVAPGSFTPPPAVGSAVVRLRPHSQPVARAPRDALLRVVRGAFAQRRKTLPNALAAALHQERSELEDILTVLGLDPRRRGETLSLEEFDALTLVLLREGRLGL